MRFDPIDPPGGEARRTHPSEPARDRRRRGLAREPGLAREARLHGSDHPRVCARSSARDAKSARATLIWSRLVTLEDWPSTTTARLRDWTWTPTATRTRPPPTDPCHHSPPRDGAPARVRPKRLDVAAAALRRGESRRSARRVRVLRRVRVRRAVVAVVEIVAPATSSSTSWSSSSSPK